jgi:DNA polymerase-3 subunit epsilon
MKAFRFVHLNVHSHYSINDGCASIKELVDAAIKDKMPGIAITDNGNMFGIMEFVEYVNRVNNERRQMGKKPFKLHESQEEIERNPEYSIFSLNLRPTFDFQQELLWNGGDVEVLEPEWPNYYNYWCSQVHGLCHEDTDDAPVFPKVWAQIEPLIEGLPLVAHNKPFDEGCLKAVFRVYQMDYPDYEFYDTLCVSRRVLPDLENHQLQTVASACGYELEDHHHALADAEACAWIAKEIL